MADKKTTPNIGLILTTDDKTLFRDWREIINGEGSEENPSNSQIIDAAFGEIKADLLNYYKKTETYSKEQVDELIRQVSSMDFKIVTSIEEITEKGHIYLLAKSSPEEGDFYDEYIFVNNKPEKIGSTKINLSDYYTKEETNTELDKKQNKLTAGENIIISENNVISATGGSGAVNSVNGQTGDVLLNADDIKAGDNESIQTNLNKINEIKQDKLTAGRNITIDDNNVISATGGGEGSSIIPNPEDEPTDNLIKIKIDDVTYGLDFASKEDLQYLRGYIDYLLSLQGKNLLDHSEDTEGHTSDKIFAIENGTDVKLQLTIEEEN